MDELYELIEQKIAASGYPGQIDGREFYDDISAEADEKEEGTYVFLIKKDDDLTYEGCMEIFEDQFDLHYVDIIAGDKKFHIDFDAA